MKANIFFLVVPIFFAEVKSTSDFESKVDGILKRVMTLIIIILNNIYVKCTAKKNQVLD